VSERPEPTIGETSAPSGDMPGPKGSPMSILEQISPFRAYGPTKAQEIAGKLEALIAESQLEAGALLATKEELRRRFEVSPATMNEAIRILQSSGLVTIRLGVKGGIFVAASSPSMALRRTLLELNNSPAPVQECWVVFTWLERLVLLEATKDATGEAVSELNQLCEKIAPSFDQPGESLEWRWRLSEKLAAIGSNCVLSAIYTALLNVIDGGAENPSCPASHSSSADALTA
jgi:DNA-binding FadR family transcriptional regulator